MSAEESRVLTVTQLNMYVKSLLESSAYLRDITLVGEISNFTNHYKSGHFYLSLKDETGLIKAVMFRQYAQKLDFSPENGMKVICKGRVSLYERDGQYQFYITSMRREGVGELSVRFEQLKRKLLEEGLFDASKKRPIPRIPRAVAVITSPTGAAVRDIMNIISRRFPVTQIIMCPVQVQGELAAPQLCDAVRRVNEAQCADTIIIGRGGGSIEDLWAFNDETLARTVRASKIPVISAVGHETDFTICDFAADLRAPTPSGAAELAVPDRAELLPKLENVKTRLRVMLGRVFEQKMLKYRAAADRPCLRDPRTMIDQRRQLLDGLDSALSAGYSSAIAQKKQSFISAAAKIESLSPMSVLVRGYSAVFKSGGAVLRADELECGDEITVRFADGEKDAVVK